MNQLQKKITKPLKLFNKQLDAFYNKIQQLPYKILSKFSYNKLITMFAPINFERISSPTHRLDSRRLIMTGHSFLTYNSLISYLLMKLQITSVQSATTPSENRRLSPHVHSDCVEKEGLLKVSSYYSRSRIKMRGKNKNKTSIEPFLL